MSLRFIDSFDHYATPTRKWTTIAYAPTISVGNGRNGTACLRGANGDQNVTLTLDNQATWIVGFAHRRSVFNCDFMALIDVATVQVDLFVNSDGTISVRRASTVLGTTTWSMSVNTWYYIELKVTISDANGVAELRVNGDTKLSLSGVDTKQTANASANVVRIGGTTIRIGTYDWDDLYICDGVDATSTQGAPFNDFLGDCRVVALSPNGAGNYNSDWTRVGTGVDSDHKAVMESPDDADSTYLSSNTAGHRSSWALGNLTVGTVKAVAMSVVARKDDAGSRVIDVFARRNGVDTDRGRNYILGDSYLSYGDIWGKHPDGAAWTASEVDNLEVGVRLVS